MELPHVGLLFFFMLFFRTVDASTCPPTYPLPCQLHNGCVCDHSAPFNASDQQTYGTCTKCDDHWAGPTCTDTIQICVNGGEEVEGVCHCQPGWTGTNCEQRECINAVGGTGPYSITQPGPDNSCNGANPNISHRQSCLPGYSGVQCQLCESDQACTSRPSSPGPICDKAILPPAAKFNGQLAVECKILQKSLLMLLGSGRPVEGIAEITCRNLTRIDTALSINASSLAIRNHGDCEIVFYRVEPNAAWTDAFFFCGLSNCTIHQETSEVTFHALSSSTKSTLKQIIAAFILFFTMLIALNHPNLVPSQKIRRRIVNVSVIGICLLVLISLLFGSGAASYASSLLHGKVIPSNKGKVIYDCDKSSCTCAPDPPAQYNPRCKSSLFGTHILPGLKNGAIVDCDPSTGRCEFNQRDLNSPIELQCQAGTCAKEQATADVIHNTAQNAKHGGAALATLIGLLTLLTTLITHYCYQQKRTNQRIVEFHSRFLQEKETGDSVPLQTHRSQSIDDVSDSSENAAFIAPAEVAAGVGDTNTPQSEEAHDEVEFCQTWHVAAKNVSYRLPATEVKALGESADGGLPPNSLMMRIGFYCRSLLGGSISYNPILDTVCFAASSGTAIALMGKSGSGKTTLLDILAAKNKTGLVNGTLRINNSTSLNLGEQQLTFCQRVARFFGRLKLHDAEEWDYYRSVIGYVAQEDTLLPSLTVRETVASAADLKLPAAAKPMRNDIVNAILDALRLQRCADTMIGAPGGDGGGGSRGLSGGERRRVSIAVELVSFPKILFLDEPTSGLDSTNALLVVQCLVDLSRGIKAKTDGNLDYVPLAHSPALRSLGSYVSDVRPLVICSIHQPSPTVFRLFDKVILLDKGSVLYAGKPQHARPQLQDLLARFPPKNNSASSPLNRSYNSDAPLPSEAEFMMSVGDISEPHQIVAMKQAALAEFRTFAGAQQHSNPTGRQDRSDSDSSLIDPDEIDPITGAICPPASTVRQLAELRRLYHPDVWQQFFALCRRSAKSLFGSYHLVACHAGVTFFVGALLACLYHGEQLDLPGALNRAGSLSFLLLILAFLSLSCLELLLAERKLFALEREAGAYGTFPYLASKLLLDLLPLRVLPTLVLGTIIYGPMGLRTDSGLHFVWFQCILVLFAINLMLMTLTIGVLFPAFGSASLVAVVANLGNFVFGGLLVQSNTIPSLFQPFRYASPFFLAFEALLVNELDGQVCTFAPTDAAGRPSPNIIPLYCVQYLFNLGLWPESFSRDVTLLIMWIAFWVLAAWLALGRVRFVR